MKPRWDERGAGGSWGTKDGIGKPPSRSARNLANGSELQKHEPEIQGTGIPVAEKKPPHFRQQGRPATDTQVQAGTNPTLDTIFSEMNRRRVAEREDRLYLVDPNHQNWSKQAFSGREPENAKLRMDGGRPCEKGTKRDVVYAVPFFVALMLYGTPVLPNGTCHQRARHMDCHPSRLASMQPPQNDVEPHRISAHSERLRLLPSRSEACRADSGHFASKNGNRVLISAELGRRPYSQISNTSAYFTALPRSSP